MAHQENRDRALPRDQRVRSGGRHATATLLSQTQRPAERANLRALLGATNDMLARYAFPTHDPAGSWWIRESYSNAVRDVVEAVAAAVTSRVDGDHNPTTGVVFLCPLDDQVT